MGRRTVQTLILIVDNEFGVLTRVTALVRREGWNIKSLVVAETMDPAVSRLTISVECLDSTLLHVTDRLGKLACVRGITAYSAASHISRELVMVTVGGEDRVGAEAVVQSFGGRVIESAGGYAVVEYAGPPEKAEALVYSLKPFGIRNVARSGAVALERPNGEGDR